MTFCCFMQGMAIGLQEYTEDVWYLTFAISAHKFVIMFCVGMELLKDNTSKYILSSSTNWKGIFIFPFFRVQMILSTVVLGLITPLGTAIGIIVTAFSEHRGPGLALVVPTLQGLAGGTLIYVAFFEVWFDI